MTEAGVSAFAGSKRGRRSEQHRGRVTSRSVRGIAGVFRILVLLVLCIGPAPALATPFVDVRAFWTVGFSGWLPDGQVGSTLPPGSIEFSCFGNATANDLPGEVVTGCYDELDLRTMVTSSQSLSVSSVGGLTVTNRSSDLMPPGWLVLVTRA